VTFVLICLRVGLPIYRRKQAMESLDRMGVLLGFGGEVGRIPADGIPGADWYHARKPVQALSIDDGLSADPAQASQRVREALVVAREFSELDVLFIENIHVDDDDVRLLPLFFPAIEILVMSGTGVTGKALPHVAKLSHLRQLDLSGTAVDDAGLANLTRLKALKYLNLDGTLVSNEGIPQLAKLPALRELHVSNTSVTDLGLEELRRTHPDLEVNDD
jgi:hypothetical protein